VVSSSAWWQQQPLSLLPARFDSDETALVLSQSKFVQAVRDALRHFVRPDALHHNPLIVSDQISRTRLSSKFRA
jgi:hypothetical protein